MQPVTTAIILTNLGAPAHNTRSAVKEFLKKTLSDRRLVDIPSFPRFILNLLRVPLRSKPLLQAYNEIWTGQDSPLSSISRQQQLALQRRLGQQVRVERMMRYAEPSFEQVMQDLLDAGIDHFIILPLFPQHCAITTVTTYDHIADALKNRQVVPDLDIISNYHAHPAYIHALADSVREHWQAERRQRYLLMSFHGLPQRSIDRGDPYHDHCLGTAHLLATMLGLQSSQWGICFHSRFGNRQWIQPNTSNTLAQLAQNGLKEIDVICPGHAAECEQTLAEIGLQNRAIFLDNGGEQYRYIPCLNDRPDHIEMMAELINPYLRCTTV